MNENRAFQGIWIPRDIWLSIHLSVFDKILLAEIDSLDQSDNRHCFATNAYFSEFMGCSEKTITRSISNLTKTGLIKTSTTINDHGSLRTIESLIRQKITIPIVDGVSSECLEGDSQSVHTGDGQNVHHNNTDINNTREKEKSIPSQPKDSRTSTERIQLHQTSWNYRLIGPEDRWGIQNRCSEDSRNLLRVLDVYTDLEITKAMDNYQKCREDPGCDIIPYQSFVAFMSKGVEKYIGAKPADFKKFESHASQPDLVCEVCGRHYKRPTTITECYTCGNEFGHSENFESRTGMSIAEWKGKNEKTSV